MESSTAFWNSNKIIFSTIANSASLSNSLPSNEYYSSQIKDENNKISNIIHSSEHIITKLSSALDNFDIQNYQKDIVNLSKRQDLLKQPIYNFFVDYYNNYKIYTVHTGNNKEDFFNFLSELCFENPLDEQLYINSYINNHYNNASNDQKEQFNNFKKSYYENSVEILQYRDLFPNTVLTAENWLREVNESIKKPYLGIDSLFNYTVDEDKDYVVLIQI